MTTPFDFSDEAFASAPTFDAAPPDDPESGVELGEELISEAEAARLLDESRQTTNRRTGSGQLPIAGRVGRRVQVRRSDVLAILDAGKPPPSSGKAKPAAPGRLPAAFPSYAARGRAENPIGERLEDLARELQAVRSDVRSLRQLLLVRGGAL